MIISLATQLFAVLLQHIGAGKMSSVANHIFEMCKTAMHWLRLRKNMIFFFIVRSLSLNLVFLYFIQF